MNLNNKRVSSISKNFRSFVIILISVFLSFSLNSVYAQNSPIDVDDVLTKIDELLNFGPRSRGSFSAKVTIIHQDEKGERSVRTAVLYRRDRRDYMMMIFTSPINNVGNGYLSAEDNLWYYDASSGEWIRRTRRERYGNTNVETQDLEQNRYKPQFNWVYDSEGKVGSIDCYVLTGTAISEDMPYPKMKIWIRKDNYLPVKEESYDVSGVLSRTAYMLNYTKFFDEEKGMDVYINDKRLIVNNIDKTQSIREYSDMSLRDLPPSMFSKSYFETRSGN